MTYLLFVIFGFVPSLIWLSYYLRKDSHPEPNSMITKVFVWGMVATLPAIAIELTLRSAFDRLPLTQEVRFILFVFIGVALVEEIMKFLVVRFTVYKNKVMDEPLDMMLYMVIAALGFAAFENILILFGLGAASPISDIVALSAVRLIGATFLHALVSGLFGYFLARAFFDPNCRILYWIAGLSLAAALHGFFNFYILNSEGAARLLVPALILLSLTIVVSLGFRQLKRLASLRN